MKTSLERIFKSHREIITYGIVGVCTTGLNICVFTLLSKLIGLPLIPSNVIAWIVAFVFSFYTNKKFVFKHNKTNDKTIKEMFSFLWTRLATMLLDSFLMWLLVEVIAIDEVVAKVLVNIIVIILNYLTSKLIVFKEPKRPN